jgi:hypothetical protein
MATPTTPNLAERADVIERQLAELRAELDAAADEEAHERDDWPRAAFLIHHDPNDVARVESIATEAGASVESRRQCVIHLGEAGERLATEDPRYRGPDDVLRVARPTDVYELVLTAPTKAKLDRAVTAVSDRRLVVA